MANERGVLVVGEAGDGQLSSMTLEMIGAARRLVEQLGEGEVSLVLAGSEVAGLAQEAIAWGADRVYSAEDVHLTGQIAEPYLKVVTAVCQQANPAIILIGQTPLGRDLAPRLAFRLKSAVAMDCIDLTVQDGRLVATRPCYGGNARAVYTWNTMPQIVTVRSKSQDPLERDPGRQGEVVRVDVDLSGLKTRVTGREAVKTEGVRLEDADIVVSGGRGLGGPEGFRSLEELAQVLGGAVGASRAVVDMGWYPVAHQVGLTGKVVSPTLYIAVGISGASQHMAGCSGARCIVAINKDKEANIFKSARYGIVADWKEIIPAFTEVVRRMKA